MPTHIRQALQALAHEAQPAHDTEATLASPGINPCKSRIATINATNFLDFHVAKGKYNQGLHFLGVQKLQKHHTSFVWPFGTGPEKGIDLVTKCAANTKCKAKAITDKAGDAFGKASGLEGLPEKQETFDKTQEKDMKAVVEKHTQTTGTADELKAAKSKQTKEISELKKAQKLAKEAKYAELDKEVVTKAVEKELVTCTDDTQSKCTYVADKACVLGKECPKGYKCFGTTDIRCVKQ